MLVLSRRPNEALVIGKALVVIRVKEIKNGQVTFEIQSEQLPVCLEEEWWEQEQEEK